MSLVETIAPGIRKIKCKNKKHDKSFIPQPHQQKIADYFERSPYRGLLLYHLLGSGKSCTSILVAKTMLESGKIKHVYVLTPGSLRTNFVKEFCNVCGSIDDLHKYYTFVTYNYNIFGHIDDIDFNNSLVIIDEAHNLINGAKNISKNPHALYNKILDSNARVLVLTGTVIFNNTYEWCLLGNLLKYDTFPNIIEHDKLDSEYFEIYRNKIMSKNNLKGIISYFPGNMGDYPEVIYNKPIKVLMSPHQDASYNIISLKEIFLRKKGPPKPEAKFKNPKKYAIDSLLWIISQKYILSRSISNMIYPYYKYDNKEEDISENELSDDESSTDIPVDNNGEINKKIKKKDILEKNGGWINSEILKNKSLLTYSPKITALIINILKNYNSKHVVFSYFIEHSGLRFIHTVLKLCKIKCVIYSGDVSAEQRQKILDKFNKPNNRYGQKIKILLMTEAGREGITLKEVGHLHILETNTIANNIKQIIGRVARYKSHSEMPIDERKVNIWKYHSYSRMSPLIFDKDNICFDPRIPDIRSIPVSTYYSKLKENLRDNVVETKKGKEFEKLIKFLEGLNIESDIPVLNNFSEYYDYFIKKGVDQQYLDEINKYISEVGNITISEDDLCSIQSIDEYLENRSEDKFEDFANFYELLQENSIEKNRII